MYVITGGAGFIGSNVAAAIEEENMGDVVISDRLRDKNKWRNISKRMLHSFVFPKDLIDFLDEYQSKVKAIIHFGSASSPLETNVDLIVENNIQLTWALWKWCIAHQVAFIYASSGAVYGDASNGFSDDFSTQAMAALRPLSPFAWSKLLIDRKIAHAVEMDKKTPPQWVGLRFFNLYGPNEYHKGPHQSVVPQIYNQASIGRLFPLFKSENPAYKDGEQKRDFMRIGDCVDVVLWFLKNPHVSGVFNVGTGRARSYVDVLNSVYAAIGEEPELDFMDLPESLKGRYQYFTQADISKLRAAGYDREFTSLEQGVEQYVRGYLATPDIYR